MRCQQCGFENPEGFAFCGKCGQALAANCPKCGFANPPGFGFCGKCGTPLGASRSPEAEGLSLPELDHLRRYLPGPLNEALRFDRLAPSARLLEQAQTHLQQLLASTASHLPPYLVERVRRDPFPGRVGGQFVQATLLFADISGFTAMSERLSRVGREGAEEITSIVNRYFSAMMAILREHGGQLIKFGGDALLGLFLESSAESAARAVQAALRMQTAMADFAETRTSQGAFPLQMKVGVRRGRFFAAELGTKDGMEYALFGADVNATAATESAAVAGQVLTDQATRAALGPACRTTPGAEGYLVVHSLEGDWRSLAPVAEALPVQDTPSLGAMREVVARLDALTPYLPAGLLARIGRATRNVRLEGEHRLVAIAFANVIGLGQTVDHLGPGREADIIAALNRYFTDMDKAAQQFGGVVNKMDLYDQGDKLLAFFGAPVAHEDDAERAVRAAWEMQGQLGRINDAAVLPVPLTQRLGISYGYVFAGYMGTDWRREYTVMGDEVNLAARLMAAAQADTITVSSNVTRKVRGLFDFTAQGSVTLKGKSEPFRLFTIDGPRAIPEKIAEGDQLHSPLVGRTAEWAQSLGALERLFAGRGQIIALTGEAGLGKSRVAEELRRFVTAAHPEAVRWVEGRCLSYTESVSYAPFREVLQHLLRLRPDDSDDLAAARVRSDLEGRLSAGDVADTLPYVLNFLDLPLDPDQREKVQYLDAEALQRRTFLALSHLIEASAPGKENPLVLALDGLQWLDAASTALLDYLMPAVDRAPVLLLLLYRPERDKNCWKIHEKADREFPHCTTHIALRPLPSEDSASLLSHLVPLDPWPAPLRDLILQRAEGNPLYIEEMLRILVNKRLIARDAQGRWQASGDLQAVQLPDTLQGVLMSRLDALEEAPRHTAQIASVIGRTFPFDVLGSVEPETRPDLSPRLAHLQQHEVVQETERAPELVYAFRHGLMQEVSYETLLVRIRREYHRKIAEILEARHGFNEAEGDSGIALIAHHAFAGQDWRRALKYQRLAGEQAQRLFANAAALDHFTRALQSAEALPPDETRADRQTVHAALGELLTTTGQYEQAQGHLNTALSLAGEAGDLEAQARACRWIGRGYELRGEYAPALEWLGRGLETLQGREVAEAVHLRLISGLIHIRQGRLDQALEQCSLCQGLAEKLHEVTALARTSILLGYLHLQRGNSTPALEQFDRALALYARAGDLSGQATTHNQRANAYFNMGQWSAADGAYREAHRIFLQLGDVYNQAMADNNLGELALNQGRLDEAVQFYQSGLRALERIGGSVWLVGVFHMNLGATFLRTGEAPRALDELRSARAAFEQAQSRDFLSELERHFAAAALRTGDLDEAEAAGQRALALARELEMQNEVGINLRALGDIARARGQLEAGLQYLGESLAILTDLGEVYQSARTRLALAQTHAAASNLEAARAELDQCEPVFTKLEAAPDLEAVRALRTALA